MRCGLAEAGGPRPARLIGAIIVAGLITFLFSFRPALEKMFLDLGDQALPALTELVLSPWCSSALAPSVAAVLWSRRGPCGADVACWWAFVIAAFEIALMLWALYVHSTPRPSPSIAGTS